MKGLYIHIPFCEKKCGYCGFFSLTDYSDSIVEIYLDAVIRDAELLENKEFNTIYIGGGTPSVIKPPLLDKFLDKLFYIINYRGDEFTAEANPESLNKDYISVLNRYNLSRLSLGVQSIDNDVLRLLGRVHDSDRVYHSLSLLDSYRGLFDLNLDLIFDIPHVEHSIIYDTVEKIISFLPEHISAYSYSFDTDHFAHQDDGGDETEFLYIKERIQRAGYEKYEISNFAVNGHCSLHNINYWKMAEYIGLGAGAHSMVYGDKGERIRFSYDKDIGSYLKGEHKFERFIVSDEKELLKEDLIFGLRMLDGLSIDELKYKYGNIAEDILGRIKADFLDEYLMIKGNRLCLTSKGELFLDYVQQYLWEL